MKNTIYLLVLSLVSTLSGCIDKNVRLYVEIDETCESCCDDLLFNVSLDDVHFGAAALNDRLLVEQPIGTTTEIAVTISENDGRENHPDRCSQCINSSINNSLWRTELPADNNYAYYNRLLLFENEDIHIDITCNPFPGEKRGLCDDMSCWTPPQDQCIAATSSSGLPSVFNTMLKHTPRGVCSEGECRYPAVDVTCSTGYCDFNGCISRPSCEDVYCLNPPEHRCFDDATLVQFSPNGYCSGGQCYYPKLEITCESGRCSDGHCEENPCQGVFCNKPPASHCINNDTLRSFDAIGRCQSDGNKAVCSYAEQDITCPYGCFKGECLATPCLGTLCINPPANYCENKDLVVFEPIGNCDNGYCRYPTHTIKCGTCEEGKCEDSCVGVICNTPPATYCTGNNTLRIFDGKGKCTEGSCIYRSQEVECDGRCENGQCVDEPCVGAVCLPPASRCDHGSVEFAKEGRCIDGVCDWEMDTITCPDGCSNGACTTEPCLGVDCKTPPSDHCLDDKTLIQYESPGKCSGTGTCQYDSDRVSCNLCMNGQCRS